MLQQHARLFYTGTSGERGGLTLDVTSVGSRFWDSTLGREYVWSGAAWVLPVTSPLDDIVLVGDANSDYTTIQAAVTASVGVPQSTGIKVTPGSYDEAVTFAGDGTKEMYLSGFGPATMVNVQPAAGVPLTLSGDSAFVDSLRLYSQDGSDALAITSASGGAEHWFFDVLFQSAGYAIDTNGASSNFYGVKVSSLYGNVRSAIDGRFDACLITGDVAVTAGILEIDGGHITGDVAVSVGATLRLYNLPKIDGTVTNLGTLSGAYLNASHQVVLSSVTASTVIYADANKAVVSLANGVGWLHNDGAGALAWSAPVAAPAGADTAVQYNDGGVMAGDATNFYYNKATHVLTLTGKVTVKPATAGIELDPNGATGNFTLSLSPANLTANHRATFPNYDILVAGSASALTDTRIPYVTTGGLLIDNAAYTVQSIGITDKYFQAYGAATGYAGLRCGASGIAHGMTDFWPTDIGAYYETISNLGGARIFGISDADTYGVWISGIIGSATPTAPVFYLDGTKKNGTNIQALSASDLLLQANNAMYLYWGGNVTFTGVVTGNTGVSVPSGYFHNALTDGNTGGYKAGSGGDVLLYRGGANLWQTPDDLTVDGTLKIGAGGAAAAYGQIDAAAGQVRDLRFYSAGSLRWIFRVTADAESGGDAGTNYQILARHDDGTAMPTNYFIITRSNGLVTIGNALKVTGAFGCNGTNPQTAYASGGALAAYGAGANGVDTAAHMSALYALVVAMRAALVANGIMS